MRQIYPSLALLLLLALSACSKATQEGSLIDVNGHHAAGWAGVTGGNHPAAYLAQPGLCSECHGADLTGGVAKVSCFSAGFSGLSCHAIGPIGHPAGFADPALHGVRVKSAAAGANGMAFCKGCHGPGFRGAGAAKDCIGCHELNNPGPNAVTGVLTNAPHSPAPWRGGVRTHTNTDPSNALACAQCHSAGANLNPALRLASYQTGAPGCFNQTLCHGQVGHSDSSTFPSPTLPWASPVNHGARARYQPNQNDGLSFCQSCHGSDFSGGTAQVGCLNSCHGVPAPHPSKGDWRPASGSFSHVNADQVDPALQDVGTSNAPVCAACHNAGAGNLSSPFTERFAASPAGSFKPPAAGQQPGCFSATMCHGDMKNDCSVCHGYGTASSTVPFQSLSGATLATNAKVGAHLRHLSASGQLLPFASAISVNIGCIQCHPVPGSPAPSVTHRNGSTTFAFGTLATAGGTLTPVVSNDPSGSVSCANTYCHGATIPGGSNTTPRWNDTGYLSASGCGTCHGFPPAISAHAGFNAATRCDGCHPHVNATNNGFIDPSKHINGVIDVTGGAAPHTFPNPGSLHKAALLASCTGCHLLSAASNPYPVAAGTPPNCRACHLNANPSSDPSCSDCHGDAATGRPNGTAFPNKAGRHTNPGAHAQVCSTCHAGGGTGVATHGNSGGTLRSAADVVLNANAAGITIVRNPATGAVNCSGTCHTGNENHGAPPGRTW